MMDISKLSDSDLKALASGNLKMMSTRGLQMLSASSATAYDPTEGMSTTDKALAGIGKGMVDLGRGVGERLGIVSPEDIAEARRLDAPLMNSSAGKVGNFIGQAAILAPTAFIPGANTYVGAALIGGGAGVIQPTTRDESVVDNALLGAAGGVAGKFVGDKVGKLISGSKGMQSPSSTAKATSGGGSSAAETNISGQVNVAGKGGGYGYGYVGDDVSAGLNPAKKDVLLNGTNLGFKVTPGQASGSRALQQMEAKLESQPMTSGTFNEIKAHNQRTLNRIAADSIGETADVVDSTVLNKALDRISNQYKLVADDSVRKIDPDQFLGKLSKIESDYEGLLPQSVIDTPLGKRFFQYAERGEATGKQLQDLASKLGKAANNQMTTPSGDRQMGMALFELKDHVDDVLESSLNGETKKAFGNARQQYRNMMLLTQRQGVINPASGDISGNALASVLQQKDRGGYLFGKNKSSLYDAARFAQAFKPIVGDSGTATRSTVTNPTDYLLTLPFNIAGKAYTSTPAISASVSVPGIMRNGLAPMVDPRIARSLPYAGLLGGSIAGANSSK